MMKAIFWQARRETCGLRPGRSEEKMDESIGTGNGASVVPAPASVAESAGAVTRLPAAPRNCVPRRVGRETAPMAASLAASPKPSKRSTTPRDEKLSEQDVLDILENALERVGRRWEPVRFSRTAGGRA